MTTISQDALKAFEDNQANLSYDWDALTAAQKLAEMQQYTKLKILARREAAANAAEDKATHDSAVAARLSSLVSSLRSKGYVGDGSLADFELLFSRDKAKFDAGQENFFGGKDVATLALNYRGDGTNALEKHAHLVSMYDRS